MTEITKRDLAAIGDALARRIADEIDPTEGFTFMDYVRALEKVHHRLAYVASRGICSDPRCKREFNLRDDGTLRAHTTPTGSRRCAGSHHPPVDP